MNRLLNLKQVTQRTKEWYKLRKKIITATDTAAILECNKFESKKDLLEKKLNSKEIISNEATEWGTFFEDVASSIYSQINNLKIQDLGLLIHPKYDWLGASPDGIMENNKLIEIKCPYSKKIFDQVPINYWIQTQIQMEVCDIEETILFVCAFDKKQSKNVLFQGQKEGIDWSLLNCKEFVIKRDKKWFESNFDRLKDFHNDLKYYRKNGLNSKKRKNNEKSEIYNKKLKTEYKNWNGWNNITDIQNYHNNDTILDWLNMYGYKLYPKDTKSISQKFIENKSKDFKKLIINYLKTNFPEQCIEITNQPDNYIKSTYLYNKTIESLKQYPIIINGILQNKDLKIYGKVDLILNSEYFKILTGRDLINYDNIIIKIEYSTLKFLKDNHFISTNSFQRNFMYVFNNCLHSNNINSIGGLIGYKSNLNNDCFQSLGLVKNDKFKLEDSIEWIKILKQEGKLWSINPPSCSELYPNMKNHNDFPWHKTKQRLAIQNDELTLLTNCGIKERKHFHKSNVFKLQDINNEIYQSPILDINYNSNNIFTPDKINNNYLNWKDSKKEIYIDFETVNDLESDFSDFPKHKSQYIIFMIGIGYNNNGNWSYYNFTVDEINVESELNILNQMNQLLLTLDYDIIYHWSNAEINFLNKSNLRHQSNFKLEKNFDLLKLFRSEPICIKGLFDYKLKNVINIMNQHKLINIKWDDVSNGLDAMVLTWKYNKIAKKNKIKLSQIRSFKSIINYNHIDCKSMFEIVKYLKKYKI